MSRKRKDKKPVKDAILEAKEARSERTRAWIICAFLVLVVAAVYWQSTGFEFVNVDDDAYVLQNPQVLAGPTPASVRWAFTTFDMGNWHPLTWISLMIDARLGSGKPFAFHLTNVILHVANVLLLFVLLSRMTGFVWRSAFVAALFAVHPLHVESVAWVAERKDVLCTLFWLLSTLAYVGYTRRPAVGRYVLVAVLFALGLMAKPMLVTLPLTLLILDFWPLKRMESVSWSRLVIEKTPLFVISVGSGLVTYWAQSASGAAIAFQTCPLGQRAANAVVSVVEYIVKMFWPSNLAAYYPHPVNTLPVWWVIGSCACVVAVTILAVLSRVKRPYILSGWLWYLVTIAPVVGIVQVGAQAMADRYTYVPLIGVFVALTWAASSLIANGRARGVAAVAVVAILTICCYRQVGYWRDSKTLWTHAIAVTKDNFFAHGALAQALLDNGDVDGGISQCQAALQIAPDHPRVHLTLGLAYARKRDIGLSINHFTRAVALSPDSAVAHNYLGLALLAAKRYEEALGEADKALELDPGTVFSNRTRAFALAGLGRRDKAIVYLEQVLQTRPDDTVLLDALHQLEGSGP